MPKSLKEIRVQARSLAKGTCRVCPVCDGRVCSGEVPGMGGAGTGQSFRNNVEALAAVKLRPRLVHRVHFPDTGVEILGFKLKFPVMVGPVGLIAGNIAGAVTESEYQQAVVFGAADAGVIAGTPDAVPDEIMKTGLDMAAKLGQGRAIPFIKPWEPERIKTKMELAAAAGCGVVCCDLDSIGLITLRIMGHPAYPKSQEELGQIVSEAHGLGLKFLIKGVMCPQDVEACLLAGVDGFVVSNHGGRVLDSVPGTAEVLPSLSETIKGRVPLLVDGGIRSGVDVLKMLALGADGVMIGRPFAIAAIGGGREGVALYAETLRSQLEQAMIMTGCPDVKSAGPDLLYS